MDLPPPRVNKKTDTAPIAARTRSQTAAMTSVITPSEAPQLQYPFKFLQSMAMLVLDETSGQSLKSQLRKHPKFAHIWNTSYANELGRLFQGIGQGSKGPKHQRVEGKKTFSLIKFLDIPYRGVRDTWGISANIDEAEGVFAFHALVLWAF